MRISLHGGNCCGIKHIYDLTYNPKGMLAARKERNRTSFGQGWLPAHNDMMQKNRYGREDFFNEAAPKESCEDRFRRFVTFIQSKRSAGVIETVINKYGYSWVSIFEELGFKEVTKALNSNTGGIITIYHLVYPQVGV